MTNPWRTANPNWREQFLAGRSLIPDLPLLRDGGKFQKQAEAGRRSFGRLRIPDVPGTPRLADAAGDWFKDIVEVVMGSYDEETNHRMIQEFFLCIPKKNGKSSYGAALMVTALVRNRRPEGEFLLIAPTIEVASISFKQARGMIRNDPMLAKMYHIQNHTKTITCLIDGSTLQIKAADTDTITGSKQVATLIDETHVFAKRSNAADVFVEIRGALASRPDGFVMQITTQSKDPPTGVFKIELDNARAVRDGLMDLPLLPIIYEMPPDLTGEGEWKQRKYWPLLNPNLGRSVSPDFLTNELMKAERNGPTELALFASQHFNVEIGLGLKTDHWPGARHWLKNITPTITLASIIEDSDVITAGIDGGGLDDLLGLAILGRDRVTGEWLLWTHAWAQREVLELRKENAPKLLELEKDRDLTLVDSGTEATDELCDYIEDVHSSGKLAKTGVDVAGIKLIVNELERRGISLEDIEGVPQGFRLQGVIKSCELQLSDGKLRHSGQTLMTWAVGNAKIKVAGNGVLVTKQASGTGKIDPVMAMFDAAALMLNLDAQHGPSVYENTRERPGGFLVI